MTFMGKTAYGPAGENFLTLELSAEYASTLIHLVEDDNAPRWKIDQHGMGQFVHRFFLREKFRGSIQAVVSSIISLVTVQ